MADSCRDGRMQIETYHANCTTYSGMQDMRSYSTVTVGSIQPNYSGQEITIKRSKSNFGPFLKSWGFVDPELQRKKRVAGYEIYSAEGKMKGTLRKSLRWIKNTWAQAVYGWH